MFFCCLFAQSGDLKQRCICSEGDCQDILFLNCCKLIFFFPDVGHLAVSRVVYTDRGFPLFWQSNANATCGYVVEWCDSSCILDCPVEWTKVPAGNTNVSIESGMPALLPLLKRNHQFCKKRALFVFSMFHKYSVYLCQFRLKTQISLSSCCFGLITVFSKSKVNWTLPSRVLRRPKSLVYANRGLSELSLNCNIHNNFLLCHQPTSSQV